MADNQTHAKRKPLRIVSIDLYRYITGQFEERHNIHSFDIQIDTLQEENGLLIGLHYGDEFSHTEEQFFSFEAIREKSEALDEFVIAAADNCKKVMVDDYFRTMKP